MAVHLPGVQNVVADCRESKEFRDKAEWQLDKTVFRKICTAYGTPEIDLFSSKLNTQLNRFVSWQSDPEAIDVRCLSSFLSLI